MDGEKRTLRAVSVAVGNCRYAGRSWLAAPKANPEDGLLDVVVVEKPGIGEALTLVSAMLSGSDYLDRRGVFFARVRALRVETVTPGP